MRPRRAIAGALLAAGLAAGCAGDGAGGTQATPDTRSEAPRLGLEVDRSASVDGVELRWWAANDRAGAAGAAIGSVMSPGAVLPPALAQRWNESGLRLVRVPRESIQTLLDAAPPAGQFSRDWKGWMGRWTPVFRGAAIDRRAGFVIDGRRESLGPGAPRVLMRAWPAPTAQGPVVRLDIALQFVDGRTDASRLTPDRASPVDAGRVLTALTAELALDPAFVYVLTSETPGVQWAGEQEAAESVDTGAVGPSPGAGEALTLGELLFSFSVAGESMPRKVIVVIVPELAGEFGLLPRADQ